MVASRSISSVLVGLTLVAAGCSSQSGNAVSPSAANASVSRDVTALTAAVGAGASLERASAARERVDVCHRTGGADAFRLLTIAASAVDAHIAHGDGLVGQPVPGRSGTLFGIDCVPVAPTAVTITFSGLSGTTNYSPFTGYTESGFDVEPISANWLVMTSNGQPAPSIVFQRLAPEPTITATARLTADGAPFLFQGVDLYSSITPIPYTFTGSRAGATVFTVSGTVPNTFGNFVTVANPQSAVWIDTLTLTLANPMTLCCANPVAFDNVVLKH